MPSKIKLARRVISSSPSVAETLASVPSLDIELPSDIGRRMFGILDNIPQNVRPTLNYSRGLLFQTNPDTGMPKLTQAGDMMLTDTGLDIAYAGDDLKGGIFDVINRGYPTKYLDPGMQTYRQNIKKAKEAAPSPPTHSKGLEDHYMATQNEIAKAKEEQKAARRSAHANQMGVPSQPVPGTNSELSLEGSSGNQPGVSSMIPRKYPSLQEVAQGVARDLAQRTPVVTEPAELVGMVAPYPSPQEFSQGVARELVQRGNPVTAPDVQVQQAVQEQAGKAAAGSNAQDVKQEAAAIQKETSTGRAGDIPWWQNPYYYLAGAGGALGGAILGNALSGGSPSYEEQMMMSQYGQMPSSFDDRYGY